jgi:hypothetical protein
MCTHKQLQAQAEFGLELEVKGVGIKVEEMLYAEEGSGKSTRAKRAGVCMIFFHCTGAPVAAPAAPAKIDTQACKEKKMCTHTHVVVFVCVLTGWMLQKKPF